ncbi:MAG: NAD-dependent epimerase/dehydratase family protein [Bacteroidia bacterium]|nr:NAD-dependent epimerase/dehydratase family protein [Bacteroidia bacterium]
MPSIAITGANGFIGSHLVSHFVRRGWRVIALVHHMPENWIREVLYVHYELEKGPDAGAFHNTDYVVHAAYVKQHNHPDSFRINLEGTKKVLELAREKQVKRTVFISSIAARSNAESAYGQQMFELQQMFSRPAELSIRPGLVIGDGGLFRSIYRYISTRKFIPMVAGGHQPMHTIGVWDLALVIDKAIEAELSGTINIAEEEAVEMKTLYKEVAMTSGNRPVFVSMPYWLAFFILWIGSWTGIAMPVSKENLLALKRARREDVKKDVARLDIRIAPYYESIAKLKQVLSS